MLESKFPPKMVLTRGVGEGAEVQWSDGTPTLHYPTTKDDDVKATSQDKKADAGKLEWGLVMLGCAKALLGVVKVMTIAVTPKVLGGRGYARGSWREVPDAKRRYTDALYRHLSEIAAGKIWDDGPEGTGQLHWDCVATNALFLSEFQHGELNDKSSV